MAYSNNPGPTMAESEAGMGAETPPMPDSKDNEEIPVSVPASSLPKGVEMKEGTELTFCLHGPPDEQGNVSGYFKGAEETGEGGESWEDDFRHEMSPRSNDNSGAA